MRDSRGLILISVFWREDIRMRASKGRARQYFLSNETPKQGTTPKASVDDNPAQLIPAIDSHTMPSGSSSTAEFVHQFFSATLRSGGA